MSRRKVNHTVLKLVFLGTRKAASDEKLGISLKAASDEKLGVSLGTKLWQCSETSALHFDFLTRLNDISCMHTLLHLHSRFILFTSDSDKSM